MPKPLHVFLLFFIIGMTTMQATPSITYILSMPRPHTHIFEVEIRWNGLAASDSVLEVKLPSWRSGRYAILDLAGGIVAFNASGMNGESMEWRKSNKNTWRISTMGSLDLVVRYSVYANEFDLRTRGLNSERGFVDGAAVFMYNERYRWLPLTLRVEPFGSWHVSTGLDPGDGRNVFVATHYDYLADCPLEIGTQKEIEFRVMGKPHILSIAGAGVFDSARLVQDISAIVKLQAEFWGDMPYDRYVFMVAFSEEGRGGTEHINSCVLGVRPFAMATPEGYRRFLGLVSHEFFHTWNIKRLRPAAINTYNWESESYSEEYWVAEGLTSYYDDLLLVRSGHMPQFMYFDILSRAIERDRTRPGNRRQSLAEASYDAWIKYWKSGKQSYNYEADYYERGAMVGLALDFTIRHLADSKKSLDDVMRLMYRRFPLGKGGFTNSDLQKACTEVAGKPLAQFFSDFVYGTQPIPWEELLSYAGLFLQDASPEPSGWLGITTAETAAGARVTQVADGGPAYEAGINVNDVIVALNGFKVSSAEFSSRISSTSDGTTVTLDLFRDGRIMRFSLNVGSKMPLSLSQSEDQSPTRKQFRMSWLGLHKP